MFRKYGPRNVQPVPPRAWKDPNYTERQKGNRKEIKKIEHRKQQNPSSHFVPQQSKHREAGPAVCSTAAPLRVGSCGQAVCGPGWEMACLALFL